MTKKFTGEQYQNIIDAWDSQIWYKSATQSVIDKLGIDYIDMGDQALALANPLTRAWAHDKFVEKEKKYYWISKDGTKSGKMHRRLYKDGFSKIHDIYIEDRYPKSENEELTESEIMSSIYNPIMFDKEEV